MNNTTNLFRFNISFSKIKITGFIKGVSCILLISNLSISNLSAQTDWADKVKVTNIPCDNRSDNSGCVTFTAKVGKVIGPNGEIYKNFKSLWVFGDGSYYTSIDTIPDGLDTGLFEVNHVFRTVTVEDAYLEIAPLYTDDDDPDKIIINNPNINGNKPSAPWVMAPPPTGNLDLITPLQPKPGDTLTYIVAFNSTCFNRFDAAIAFGYDSEKVEVVSVSSQNVSQVSFPNQDTLEINFNSFLGNGDNRTCFIRLHFKDVIQVNDSLIFNVIFKNEENDTNCLASPVNKVYGLKAVESHDPNKITTDISSICTNHTKPDSIEYGIIFQNIGNRVARTVVVTDILPDQYDINSIKLIRPDSLRIGTNFSVNKQTRELRWLLYNDNLKPSLGLHVLSGLNEDSVKDNNLEWQTLDTIIFKVKFDESKTLQPCGSIINQAKIRFDIHDHILTNISTIPISCDHFCAPCNLENGINQKAPMEASVSNPRTIDLAINNGGTSTITWYPTAGLDDPASFLPTVAPSDTTLYTAVVTKGCDQKRYQIRVDILQDSNSCNLWWIALGPFAIISIFLAIYIIKKNKKT